MGKLGSKSILSRISEDEHHSIRENDKVKLVKGTVQLLCQHILIISGMVRTDRETENEIQSKSGT